VRYDGEAEAERMAAAQFRKQQRETIRMSVERIDARGFE
jgi:hypothetical protein